MSRAKTLLAFAAGTAIGLAVATTIKEGVRRNEVVPMAAQLGAVQARCDTLATDCAVERMKTKGLEASNKRLEEQVEGRDDVIKKQREQIETVNGTAEDLVGKLKTAVGLLEGSAGRIEGMSAEKLQLVLDNQAVSGQLLRVGAKNERREEELVQLRWQKGLMLNSVGQLAMKNPVMQKWLKEGGFTVIENEGVVSDLKFDLK